MARRKSKVVPAPVVSDVPQLPALTREELLNLRLLDTEARLAARDASATKMEKDAYLARIDPQHRLAVMDAHMAGCKDKEEKSRSAYRELLTKTGKRLGIDLTNGCAIDPESGVIIQHEKKE